MQSDINCERINATHFSTVPSLPCTQAKTGQEPVLNSSNLVPQFHLKQLFTFENNSFHLPVQGQTKRGLEPVLNMYNMYKLVQRSTSLVHKILRIFLLFITRPPPGLLPVLGPLEGGTCSTHSTQLYPKVLELLVISGILALYFIMGNTSLHGRS